MSFLAPLFLLGAISVALPVLFHLIRRSSRERVPFSSLMFLLPSPPRVTRRSRLENVFLLILRCLVLCFLAMAFARPFLSRPVAPDLNARAGQTVVLLVDTSASMRRGSLWSDAKARAKSILRSASPADRFACFGFDRGLHPLVTLEQWSSTPASDRVTLASKQLDEANPGWGSTRLGPALIEACDLLESAAKNDQGAKHIVVLTDLQEGSRLDGLQGFEWPRGIEVTVEVLKAAHASNAGLQLASDPEDADRSGSEPTPRVRVTNASDSKREQFKLGWRHAGGQDFIGPTVDTYVPPGQSRVVAVPKPTGDLTVDRIVLDGDDDDFDNTAYVVPTITEHAKILFLGNDSETDPTQLLYYLKRVFPETRKLAVEVAVRRLDAPLASSDLDTARLVIVNGALSEEQVRSLRSFLDAQKAVLVALTHDPSAATLARLAGSDGLTIEEASEANYAMLGQIDFEHPLFAPFADPRYSDFTKIHFWKHRRVSLDKVNGSRVLARFDNGDPALGEIPVGKGRLWVLTSGWQPQDSQMALSSKFVPLLYAMLEQSGGIKEGRSQYSVGDVVNLPSENQPVTIRRPDTSEVKLARGEKFTGTDAPGIYVISPIQPPASFAVNLTPEESKTAPLPLEELERLGVPLQHQLTTPPKLGQQRREHLQAVELENQQKLWRRLIVAALVILVMETWLAGRLTRRGGPAVSEMAQA
jgi:hypothetical protein